MEITNTYKNIITGAELFDGTEINAITLVNGGSGYVENDILNLAGNVVKGKSAIVKVLTVDGSGAILTFNLEYHGYGYLGVGNVSSSGGSGTAATFDITNLKTANTIYSDRHLGNDATGNGTKSNPYATLTKLLSITVASTNVNRVFLWSKYRKRTFYCKY